MPDSYQFYSIHPFSGFSTTLTHGEGMAAPKPRRVTGTTPLEPLARRRWLGWLLGTGLLLPATGIAADAPALLLAHVYRPGTPLADYWVSEKYDGVRGFWDGQTLRTRGGETVVAPAWFTAGWPAEPMDGELWAGRGQFTHAQSTTRQQQPDDAAWRQMRFMVFDLPQIGRAHV